MDSAGDPELACIQCDVVVHPQSINSGSTLRGQAGDSYPVFAPTKVFVPSVAAWIEKLDQTICFGIARAFSPFFEQITERTTQAEIFEDRFSAR
jgi:hypothetical protein